MKKTELGLIAELVKNSRKSDRELGKILGVSQPTVTRTRIRLEKTGMIQEYTIVPDLTKLGFEVMAITTGRYIVPRTKEFMEKAKAYMKKFPNILFSARAQGMGRDAVIISLHENFTDYDNFMATLKTDWGTIVGEQESILISLKGFVAKPFSLRYLSEIINLSRKVVSGKA